MDIVVRTRIADPTPEGRSAGDGPGRDDEARSFGTDLVAVDRVLREGEVTQVDAPMHATFIEHDVFTEARLTLCLRDLELTGFGRARRHPHDPSAPRVGEELAAARAAADLAQQLLDLARYQLEKQTGRETHLEL